MNNQSLLITNMDTEQRREMTLSKTQIVIGGEGTIGGGLTPDILLESRRVSQRHAILRLAPEGVWTIEHIGESPTLLDDRPVERGRPRILSPGGNIRIDRFTLVLVAAASDSAAMPARLRTELMAFEAQVHARLLERMDLRDGGRFEKIDSPETRQMVERHLRELVEAGIRQLDPASIDGFARAALHRRLSSLIAASGLDRRVGQKLPVPQDEAGYEEQIATQELRLAQHMRLSFDMLNRRLDPRRMDADIARLDDGFGAAYATHEMSLGRGLKLFLASNLVRRNILDLIYGLGPLEDLMEMDNISEIMVVARDRIFVEKGGLIEDVKRSFYTDESLISVIERILAQANRRIDMSEPMVDARLKGKHRMNAVIPPLAQRGPCLTIRKFRKDPIRIADQIAYGSLNRDMADFLKACVEIKKNIIISGGTGTGKTTMLNSLSGFIPAKERIVTIEDTAELQLQQEHVVTLEARRANQEGKGEVSIRDLVRNALRMRPDRIVVGECRGGETLDMLQAMNTGHDGSLTTAHANSAQDMMLRLETMVLSGNDMPIAAIREQIAAAINIVVQMTRYHDGSRRVSSISEVLGVDRETGMIVVEPIFTYRLAAHGVDAQGRAASLGRMVRTGYMPSFMSEVIRSGSFALERFLQPAGSSAVGQSSRGAA